MSDGLDGMKARLLAALNDAYEDYNWTDAELEEALRSGLAFYNPFGLPRETSFTVTTTGYEQDLSSVGAHAILLIAWPWADGYSIEKLARDWRFVDEDTVRFDAIEIAADEVLRIRYRPRHTIARLDGETTTTLWDEEVGRFLLVAASRAAHLRARRIVQRGGSADTIKQLTAISEEFMAQFLSYENRERTYLVWGAMGL